MEYRKLGRTGLNVSAIGLGTEHLGASKKNIDGIFRTAVEAGVNYIDIIGSNDPFWNAVRTHRDKLILAAHWIPSNHSLFRDTDACQRHFEDVLAHTGNNYAEVGMLTLVNNVEGWEEAERALERLQRFKEQGRIGYIGMSTHELLGSIIDVNSGLIDVLMVPINLMGLVMNLVTGKSEESRELCQACVKQDVGLVAMKPYRGGGLFFSQGKPTGITPTQCLAYVLSHPVSTTVPGVSTVEHLQEALHYLEATNEEKDYRSVIENIPTVWRGECLHCGHCHPCPVGIDIASVILNVDLMGSPDYTFDELVYIYGGLQVKASECTECGVCMERCPFEVDVIARMREAVKIFEVKTG
jgi:predicted aldo/keto reductase-like oxidoreductase